MKKTFKAALSIFCSVMLLASLIIPSLVLPAAAYTFPTGQDTITYTFDGTDFKADTTVAGVKVSGGQYSVTGGALKIAGDKNLYDGAPRSVIFNNGSDILRLDPGAYAVSFKYRYEYSKHTNNLYCANYNNYKSNAQYFNFTVNTPEGTGVPAGEVGTTIVKDFITTNESISGSTQKEKTVLVNITGSSAVNFGIRSAYLECDVYIDEITIARKTSIEIIPTDGTTTAMAEVISGVPGTAATLPDASVLDGAIAGKVFEGFYADAAFTTPVTQAMIFPTDTITKTIYAKMVVDNSVPAGTIIFDFDNNNAGMKVGNNTVESLRVSGGAFGLNDEKPAAAQGNILSINGSKTADNHGDNRDLLFNDGSNFIPLAAGTYDISYDYFVENRAVTETANCPSCQNFFDGTKYQHIKFVTLKKSDFSWSSHENPRGVLSDGLFAASVVSETIKNASGSGTVTITVTDQMVEDGANYLGLRIATLSYAVWLDNIVIKPVVEKPANTVIMDFENDTANYTDTTMLKIEDSTGKDGNPSKVFLASSNNQIRTQLVKDKNGNTYSLKAGKWKVTYDYKVPANASQKLWLMYNVTKTNHPTITPPTSYTTGVNIIDENLVKEFDKGNAWVSGSITFTLDADVDYIGFGALTNGAGNGVYLDNVVFTPVVEKPANTVIMDFENDTANHTGSAMLKIESSTDKDGNPSKVFLASSNDQIRTQLVKDKNDKVYSLTKGVWKVTYDYKVPTNANQKLWLLHDVMVTTGQLAPNGATTPYTSGLKLSQVNLAKVTNMGDTWLSDSIVINVTADEGVKNIGFGAQTGSASNAVYIDNVVFTEVTDSAVNLSFNTNGGNDIAPVQGLIGETITVADPVKAGFDFVGWYENSACTIPSDMKFKVGVSTLYAAWTEAGKGLVFDFDTKNKNFAAGGNWSGGAFTLPDDPKGESGKTLGIMADLNSCNHASNLGNERDILFNDGASEITLEAGTYKIDYKYYAVYVPNGGYRGGVCESGCNNNDAAYANISAAKFRFGVLGDFDKGKRNVKAAATGNLFDLGLVNEAYESRWINNWTILTVTDAMVADGKNKLVLTTAGVPYAVYLDNIKVSKVDPTPVTLLFDSKGGTSVNSITTQSYTVVNYPTPTKAGYNFTGWVDAYGNPAPQYAPTVNTTFYATWEEAGKYAFIDMDNGFLTGDANTYGSGYFTKNTTKFKDDPAHKNTLRFFNTNDANITRIHLLSSENRFAQVAPGKLYKVTFDYYVEQLPDANDTQFDFTVNHNNADRWLYAPHKAKRLTGGNILDNVTNKSTDLVGKWMTKEIAVVIPTNITDSRLGILSVNGKGAIIHFDNIKFESIEGNTVLLTYVIPATGQTAYIIGDRGTRIDKSKIPVLNSEKLEFTGWFTDEACTKPFSADVFPSKSMTIYGGTQLNTKGVHINFMDYPWKGDTSSSKISLSVMDAVNDGISYDGDGWALKFDNTNPETQTTENKRILLNLDASTFPLQDGADYLFTYRYYIVNAVSAGTVRIGFNSGGKDSMWGTTPEITPVASASAIGKHGRWITGFATGKVEATNSAHVFLQARIGVPLNAVVYFDDFIVQQIPEGYVSAVFATDYGKTPDPVIVKAGSTINLPNKISGMPSDKKFTGWSSNGMKFGTGSAVVTESTSFVASIVTPKFTESFENWSSEYTLDDHGFDADYAIYDSKAQGNSSDNVKSGRYSLHRLGKEPAKKGYSLYMNNDIYDKTLSFGNIYTVSMWVKVVNPVHTTGGIEIRNNDTFRHAWGSSIDPMKVVAIKDIADGQWHKISYTFEAMARYVSIFTPGNLEIFIDDVTIEYTPNAIISMGANYVEYVPAFLTEEGKYVNPEENKDTLNEFELFKRTETVTPGGSYSQIVELITQNVGATIAIIAGAVVLLAGVAVVIVVLIKKRKAKEVK